LPKLLRRFLRGIDRRLCSTGRSWRRRDYKPGAPRTLSHFVELSYIPIPMLGASPRCLHQHRMTLHRLPQIFGHEPLLSDLTDETLAAFMRASIAAGQSPATANNRRCYVSAWWRFAKRRGLVATLPDVPKVKEFLREPSAWELNELTAIVSSIEN